MNNDKVGVVNKVIILNGRRLTEQEFQAEKVRIQTTTSGIQLIEVSPGVYKTRLLD